MAKDIGEAVREVCLWFPESAEIPSRGSPDFRVRNKTFASYIVNHHGDGNIALWLPAPPGAQELYSEAEPNYYFVPPYVGPRGWLGVHLDQGLSWMDIASRVREAFVMVAPKSLGTNLEDMPPIDPPTETVEPTEFDPMLGKRAQEVLAPLREICLSLPETSEGKQFGKPVWKAGKKSFCTAYDYGHGLHLSFWVGADMQAMLTFEDRYVIPAYTGHNGWISLNVDEDANWDEIRELILTSYRHFALKRMLKELDPLDA
ncbi:MAG: MmcQ/YjbR family DNA-binding protein [Gammaproteobacteria bacterium]|nr:MmcQ/YjbR family DNA-binding protein [Gammaproteobacteria bacterium]